MGLKELVLFPFPSCPKSLLPQVNTNPYSETTITCLPVIDIGAIYTICLFFKTIVGFGESSVFPLPNYPLSF